MLLAVFAHVVKFGILDGVAVWCVALFNLRESGYDSSRVELMFSGAGVVEWIVV